MFGKYDIISDQLAWWLLRQFPPNVRVRIVLVLIRVNFYEINYEKLIKHS